MIYVLITVHVVISLFLILVVLLQQGKGADLSVFGGGGSQTAFGARGAATVLHKATVICFVLFILTTLTIGILQSRSAPSVMGGVAAEPATTTSPEASPTAPAGGVLPENTTPSPEAESPAPPPPAEDGALPDDGAPPDGGRAEDPS